MLCFHTFRNGTINLPNASGFGFVASRYVSQARWRKEPDLADKHAIDDLVHYKFGSGPPFRPIAQCLREHNPTFRAEPGDFHK
jgi:hypothetical protein